MPRYILHSTVQREWDAREIQKVPQYDICLNDGLPLAVDIPSVTLPVRHGQQQKWQPHAKRRSTFRLRPVTLTAHCNGNVGRLNFSSSARQFLSSLGHRISTSSREARGTCFLFQRISVLFKRFNAVLYSTTVAGVKTARTEYRTYLLVFKLFLLKSLRNIPTDGIRK